MKKPFPLMRWFNACRYLRYRAVGQKERALASVVLASSSSPICIAVTAAVEDMLRPVPLLSGVYDFRSDPFDTAPV